MNNKTLAQANSYLTQKKAVSRRVRSLASSTAIETGVSIQILEKRVKHLRASKHRVALA